MPLTSAKIDNW